MANGKFTGMDIVQDIEKQILDRKLVRGVRLETSRELAQRYAVSQKTVERAMRHLCHRGLISRVRGKGTFVLSCIPMFHKQRVCFLTFLQETFMEDSQGAFYAAFGHLEQQIQQQLFEAGYNLDHITENTVRAESRDALLCTRLEKYDTVIAPAGAQDYADQILRSCQSRKILIGDDEIRHGPWHQIVYDYRPGFAKAVQFFRKKWVRKIISVGFTNDETSVHRLDVFREEAIRHGYATEDIVDYFEENSLISRFFAGQNFAEYYLGRRLFDHAIFSSSDFLMIGMMMVFQKRGVVPGRDFQLISYDNFESHLNHPDFQFGIPGITHPQDAMVKALISMLGNLDKSENEDEFYQSYFVPAHEFIIRPKDSGVNQESSK